MKKTIAVLPFMNMSSSTQDEYFSDGMTEEIINALAKIPKLKVSSRTSSFFFKNQNVPIPEIGQKLNVSIILEGSVRRAGEMVRITAQLIQAQEDFHFWSETWDRTLENIFEVQDEISLLIADKLREQFGHLEIQEHLVEKKTDQLRAYECALKARFHSNKWNPSDMQQAIELYQQAKDLDPAYVEAYTGLADCYGFMAMTGFMSYEEAWGKATALTNQALKLNPQSAEAYYQLANLAFFTECNYQKAFTYAQKTLTLNANYAEAQQFMSYLYVISGRYEMAWQHIELALSINPLSQETRFFQAYYLYKDQDYTQALAILDQILAENPKNIPAHTVKCHVLLVRKQGQELLDYLLHSPEEVRVSGDYLGLLTLAYLTNGDEAEARKHIGELEKKGENPYAFHEHVYLYLLYAAQNQADKAFASAQKTIEAGSPLMLIHFDEPIAQNLRTDPRHQAICQKLYPHTQEETSPSKNNAKKPLLDSQTAEAYATKLKELIHQQQPYLDAKLSLRKLAQQLDIHPNQLSWLLNEVFDKNFNEFINHYRVTHFKEIAQQAQYSHLSILGMAYESGFNSKTVFHTYFKKETGQTPKQYLKQL